jgi:hypothetical protein
MKTNKIQIKDKKALSKRIHRYVNKSKIKISKKIDRNKKIINDRH